ncbi:hypothetical protein MTO96_051555 [Rhipicephalus appendiculatus]
MPLSFYSQHHRRHISCHFRALYTLRSLQLGSTSGVPELLRHVVAAGVKPAPVSTKQVNLVTMLASIIKNGETSFVSGFTTISQQDTLVLLKAIICTIGEGAILEEMYPPDKYCDYLFYTNVVTSYTQIFPEKDPGSWSVFLRMVQNYKLVQPGISFSLRNVTPTDLDDAAPDLDYLRRQGIRHYGLLTVLAVPKEFDFTMSSTKAIIKRLKEIQGGDRTAKTVLAFGSCDYSVYFVNKVKDYFINATKYVT